MNKRIEELAHKAHLDWCIQNDWDQKNIQEFAELIVKECAMIANQAENNDSEFRCMYDVVIEHFGIKD